MAYVMEDVPAGSTLDNLEIQILDASGMESRSSQPSIRLPACGSCNECNS